MPKGVFCFRAHFFAAIMPSVPRCTNPPGTRMPFAGFVEGRCVIKSGLLFEMRGFDLGEVEILPSLHAAVLEELDDREIAAVERAVFPANAIDTVSKRRSCCMVKSLHSTQVAWLRTTKALAFSTVSRLRISPTNLTRPCFSRRKRNMVGGRDVVNANHLLWFDLAEHSDFVGGVVLKLDLAAAFLLQPTQLAPILRKVSELHVPTRPFQCPR
jgi:hypothetical protein